MSVSVNPPVNSVIFPDGTQILAKFISSVQAVAAVVNVGIGDTINAYSYTASSPADATEIVTQIYGVLIGNSSGAVVLVDSGISLVWTSVTPATGTSGTGYGPEVFAGTGFAQFASLPNGAFQIKATDGVTVYLLSVNNGSTLVVDSDIQITDTGLYRNAFNPVPGTFTFYYSTDGGATWTTTGLTLTVT